MKPRVILVLPAHNEGGNVQKSLARVKKGIEKFSNDFNFTLYIIDDKSNDNTLLTIERWASECGLQVIIKKNQENLGLVRTLKEAYEEILKEKEQKVDYILKTDLDKDFDQYKVIETLVPCAKKFDVVVGIRWREIKESENSYEYKRRESVLQIIKKEFNEKKLDPASSGSQFYRADALRKIIETPAVESFDRKWGLDFLIPLMAKKVLKLDVEIINIEKGEYDKDRRGEDKVKSQYDIYDEIIKIVLKI